MKSFTKEEIFDFAKELCELAVNAETGMSNSIKALEYLGDFDEMEMVLDDREDFPKETHIFEGETNESKEGIGITITMPNEYDVHLFIPYEFINDPDGFKDKLELLRLEGKLEMENWMKKIHEAKIKDHQASLEASKKLISKYNRMIGELKIKMNGGKITY